MPRWQKFRELSWSDRGFLIFAMAGLASVGMLLAIAGFERSVAWLRQSSRRAIEDEPSAATLEWARSRARLTSIAARFGPYRATCLRRSLFYWWITRRNGIDSELKIGVLRDQGELLAHAWIEFGGEVLNDRVEVVQSYSTFDATRLPEQVSWS